MDDCFYSFGNYDSVNLFKGCFVYCLMKIHAIGGYNEVGKNMTALDVGEDIILFDSGLFLPAVVGVQERDKIPTEKGMRSIGALPDDLYLDKKGLREKVRALLISHAHLDHVGALQYNAHRYKANILGTPFTMEVLKVLAEDSNMALKNKIVSVNPNGSYNVKGKNRNYKIEFINMTHSTIQSTLIAVHTPEGVVLYANDYKLDNSPVFGDKPNYKRLKELSKQGVKALVVDCLYAPVDRKTPSEKIARGLLEDVFFTTDNRNSGMIVTTFSSHIARLKSITEFGKKLGREVVLFGRSLNKYVSAARNVGKAPFIKDVKIYTYRRQLEKAMKRINKNKRKYLVVCTGHQGEPGAILDRISRKQVPLHLENDDHIIFSSKTIPSPINELNREQLEKRLKKYKVRIFDNVHVSGHGGREDLRDLIKLTSPEHVIPSHGDLKKTTAGAKLAEEMGYRMNKTVHLMQNGQNLVLK
jgi:ribonuclease J